MPRTNREQLLELLNRSQRIWMEIALKNRKAPARGSRDHAPQIARGRRARGQSLVMTDDLSRPTRSGLRTDGFTMTNDSTTQYAQMVSQSP